MRRTFALLFVVGCGGSVADEPYVPAVDAPVCAAEMTAPANLWVKRIDADAVAPLASDGCGDAATFTVVDLNAQCTLGTASGATLCEGPTRVSRTRMRLMVQGPTVLPTLNQEMDFAGSKGVTYQLAALGKSFSAHLPAFGPDTAAAVVAINPPPNEKYCAAEGAVVSITEVPSATIRYLGGGAATDRKGFAAIEGVPPGRTVDVQVTKPGCGSSTIKLRFERGLVSVVGVWIERT